MEALPYYVPYEYVPFAAPNGKSAGDYNELVYQVFLGGTLPLSRIGHNL